MRVELKELLEKLGVRHVLSPYETFPWVYYDEDTATTCSAEVRMGPDGDMLEAEVQFLKDDDDEDDDKGKEEGGESEGPISQKMHLRARKLNTGQWSPVAMTIKKEDFVNKTAEWEDKSCAFFKACIQAMQMDELPNIDLLLEQEFPDEYGGRSGRGKIGRKSPKVKPGQLLGMKKM